MQNRKLIFSGCPITTAEVTSFSVFALKMLPAQSWAKYLVKIPAFLV
jgi:hypothetical protein